MNRIDVIRHLAFEDLGCFADVFEERGLAVHYHEAGIDDLGAVGAGADPLVILGGPISANDVDDFPFLADEVAILRTRIERDWPTLGICLGAQLIARAAGARVYAGAATEIGWAPVSLTAAGEAGPLASLKRNGGMVLHWHGETFDLPEQATLLASNAVTPNQGFAIGQHVLGLQFHVEATRQGMERWFIGHSAEIAATEGISVGLLRAQTAQHAAAAMACGADIARAWLQSLTGRASC